MQKKQWLLCSLGSHALGVASVFVAQSFWDYSKATSSANLIRARDDGPFSWENYAGPESDVFFDEGHHYIPPRPYRYLAAHPTLENAIQLQLWQLKKIEVSQRVSALLLEASQSLEHSDGTQRGPVSSAELAGMSILYFYKSSCPSCQAARDALEKLRTAGAQVIPVQVDHGEAEPLYTDSIRYDKDLQKSFPITAVPTLVVRRGEDLRRLVGQPSVTAIAHVFQNSQTKGF